VPKDQEVLTGVVERIYLANGNRPAKLIVTGEETFELTIYPPSGVEQPWDEQTQLPILDNLPTDIVGVTIQAIAEPKGEYNGVAQYKPSKITVLNAPEHNGSNPPSPKAAPAAPAAPAQPPAQRPGPRMDTQRDSIERQVAAKGAIELLSSKIIKPEEFDPWFEHILDKIQGREAAVDAPTEDPEDDFGSL
jgi:hypothetical protein